MTEDDHYAIVPRDKPSDVRAIFIDKSEADMTAMHVFEARGQKVSVKKV